MIRVRPRAVRISLRIRHARRGISRTARRRVAGADRRSRRQLFLAFSDFTDEKRRQEYRRKDERDRDPPHE